MPLERERQILIEGVGHRRRDARDRAAARLGEIEHLEEAMLQADDRLTALDRRVALVAGRIDHHVMAHGLIAHVEGTAALVVLDPVRLTVNDKIEDRETEVPLRLTDRALDFGKLPRDRDLPARWCRLGTLSVVCESTGDNRSEVDAGGGIHFLDSIIGWYERIER